MYHQSIDSEWPDKFENIFVDGSHYYDVSNNSMINSQSLLILQSKAVRLEYGLNIFFGQQLRNCIDYSPEFYNVEEKNFIHSSKPFSERKLGTYNTGTEELKMYEKIAIVPPMCDSPVKIQNVIPLQTVSCTDFNRQLNNFLAWLRIAHQLKMDSKGDRSLFKKLLDITDSFLEENHLIKETLKQVKVPDSIDKSRLEILYEIANKYWIEPLLGIDMRHYQTKSPIMQMVDNCRALQNKEARAMLVALAKEKEEPYEKNKILHELVHGTIDEQELILNAFRFYSEINIKPIGIIQVLYPAIGDNSFTVKPQQKMLVRTYQR